MAEKKVGHTEEAYQFAINTMYERLEKLGYSLSDEQKSALDAYLRAELFGGAGTERPESEKGESEGWRTVKRYTGRPGTSEHLTYQAAIYLDDNGDLNARGERVLSAMNIWNKPIPPPLRGIRKSEAEMYRRGFGFTTDISQDISREELVATLRQDKKP